ncbi:hypothetical protein TNCV_5070851 [Trichonephila clavipes]|nr:hypothetical protein TNCV_5070851 [Trichonephila clavipes]
MKQKGCAAFHSRRESITGESPTSFQEDTSMVYMEFEPEPTSLQAEGHNHYTVWAANRLSDLAFAFCPRKELQIDVHFNGGTYNTTDDIEQFDANNDNPKEKKIHCWTIAKDGSQIAM